MNYKKLFGYGFFIWAAAYLIATGFVAYKMGDRIAAKVATTIAVIIVAYWAGRRLNAGSVGEILKYSIGWAVIGFILDLVFTVPFTGIAFLTRTDIMVGYVIVIIAPLFAARKTQTV